MALWPSVMNTMLPAALIKGYRQFQSGRLDEERRRAYALADSGQKPETLVIACCDSRAAPETIFSAQPGEIFVVRNVANLVPPYAPDGAFHSTSAAIEYAVTRLKVRHVVVLGHGRCGGIEAALSTGPDPSIDGDFIGKWVELLKPAAAQVSANSLMTVSERRSALELISVRNSISNLRTFPWLADLEREGTLSLHGAWFDISTAELWAMQPDTGDFRLLTEDGF